VASGYWPLFRYIPAMRKVSESPFRLDSRGPQFRSRTMPITSSLYALALTRPTEAAELLRQAQADVQEKYRTYEEFANLHGGRRRHE